MSFLQRDPQLPVPSFTALGEPVNSRPGKPWPFYYEGLWGYILQSESTGRFYCGQTSHLERRLTQHNDPVYQLSKTTRRFEGPWRLVWSCEFADRSEAMKIEKHVKKRGISRFVQEASTGSSPVPVGIDPV